MTVLDLHFQLFIVAVGQIAADAAHDLIVLQRWLRAHIDLLSSTNIKESSPINVSVKRRNLDRSPMPGWVLRAPRHPAHGRFAVMVNRGAVEKNVSSAYVDRAD